MIIGKEFIWREDHFVCHITEDENMQSIINKGLLPSNGKRCQSVNDNRKGVFFFDGLYNVENWAQELYENKELEMLKVLRFNLKNRIWYMDNSNPYASGFYLPYKVLPDKISWLNIIGENGKEKPITKLFNLHVDYSFCGMENGKSIKIDDCYLSWQPISKYKVKK